MSGGNIDVNVLSRVIERGLAKDGRLVRLEVRLNDTPGALYGLIGVIAAHRANVLHISHARAFGAALGETLVSLDLETRGPAHVAEILDGLRAAGYEHRRHRV